MFLLASDFDRTFYINNSDFKRNVELLDEFMKKNMFVIVTGRSYDDYMKITKNYVPTNYLVINHGATILKNNKVIKSCYIDNNTVDKLKEILDFNNITYFATHDKESRVSINTKDLSKINISMKDNLVAKKAVDYINNHFNDIKAYLLFHKNQFEIVSIYANKKCAIDYISSLEGISRNNVYTVGDGYSDIEMVKYYNGYAIKSEAVSDLIKVANSTVTSVGDIINFLDVEISYEKAGNIVDFINECYEYNHYFEKYMAKVYKHGLDNNHIVIRKSNEIIGCALIYPNKIYINNDILDILTVGSVCVKEKYRKKGYLKMLFGAIAIEEKKYDLTVLSGDMKRYDKFGYYPNILNLYKINKNRHDNIIFKEVNDNNIIECLNMYNKNIHSCRNVNNFKAILKQWKSDSYFIYQNNEFTGYLIYNTKQDYISEIKTTNIINVIEEFAFYKKRDYINVSVLNNDYELKKILSDYELSSMYSRHLYSINNIEKVISVCLNNKLKYSKLEEGILSIKFEDKILKITVDSNKVIITSDLKYDIELTKKQFMDLLLNKKMIRNRLLSSWFYLDLDIYNNDLV